MKIQYLNDYIIDDSINRIDFAGMQSLLKTTFWSPDISVEEVKKGAYNSALVLGTYTKSGNQVGYMRVISDKTRFAYILDVFVDPGHRQKGIARAMVKFALQHVDLKDVYQWLLVTKDAHEVYRKVGFQELQNPDKWMGIIKPRPER